MSASARRQASLLSPDDRRRRRRATSHARRFRPTDRYYGHNWELYGLWSSFRTYLAAVEGDVEGNDPAVSLAMFGVVGIGAVGCVLGGEAADRIGRITMILCCLVVSTVASLVCGHLEASGSAVLAVGLVWGVAVVADSAQYSALVSETCPPELMGTALTVQPVRARSALPSSPAQPFLLRASRRAERAR